MLVTRLRPGPWPLVRYETGDRARPSDAGCECGYVGPSLLALEGRGYVRFVRPDGERIDPWRLSALLKHHAARDYRLTQVGPSAFALAMERPPEGIAGRRVEGRRDLGWRAPELRLEGGLDGDLEAKPRPFVGPS